MAMGKPHRLGCGSVLVILAAVFLIEYVGFTPWALHMGGRSTWAGQWDGLGEVRASNGGKYVLFTHLAAGIMGGTRTSSRHGGGGHGRRDNLNGTARLCTDSGLTYTFKLTGIVEGWRTTDGASTWLNLTGGEPTKLPSGWVVALRGRWNGPDLELASPDNSFTEVFTPRGAIRRVTSTADAGTAHVTLRFGTEPDFTAACRALQAR
jgi:hypothetical protein